MTYVLVSVGTLAVSGLIVVGVLGAAVALLSGRGELTLTASSPRGLTDPHQPRRHGRAHSLDSSMGLDRIRGLGLGRVPPNPTWSLPTLQAPQQRWTPTRHDISPYTRETGPQRAIQGHDLPERFGPYHLHELLGRGAMGQVWRAFDTRRRRWIALKLLSDDPCLPQHARNRMQHEAQLAGRLSSAHVIPVHDFGQFEGTNFLDMRLVPGGDLATLLRAHPQGLDPHRVVRITTQIADALDAAHAAGLTHCDVKPSNVLLDTTATGDFCYLADFGIATLTTPGSSGASTASTSSASTAHPDEQTIFGTPTYMAPEMFTGIDAASPASDVYALGVVIHELLTGRPPFPGPDLHALRRQHADRTPPRLSGTDPVLSAALDAVLTRALDKNPHHRHRSAGTLAAALTAALDNATEASAQPTPTTTAPPTEPAERAMTPSGRPLRGHTLPGGSLGDSFVDSLDAVFLTADPPDPASSHHVHRPTPQAA